MAKKIFVIEDDENIRELIKMALTSFSYQVQAFDNAEDAMAAIKTESPDMAIFDIMLPGMSGLEATRQLRNHPKTKDLPILLLTAKDSELDKVTGLDSGADDYMVKPFGVLELGARIRSIFRRVEKNEEGEENDLGEISISDLIISFKTREVFKDGNRINLTYKEFELLSLLVRQKDKVLSREELLNAVWGYDFHGESRTLDIHIRTIRQKLGDDVGQPKYIKTVRNVGYRFIGE